MRATDGATVVHRARPTDVPQGELLPDAPQPVLPPQDQGRSGDRLPAGRSACPATDYFLPAPFFGAAAGAAFFDGSFGRLLPNEPR